ncbi:MAG TPA: excalibur calcium-binding domain-containing protein [Rhizomicrobium sp.]|jgi:hypothetical protein|nr:excalibur calcium-binding domain-containing protein [Rhizomicrobium sp.]
MQDGNLIALHGRKRRDSRAGRWPILIAAGMVGFVCGALYVSAPLHGTPAQSPAGIADSIYYPNCAAARAAGAAPLRFGEPGYRPPLDADGDGVACEPYRPRT